MKLHRFSDMKGGWFVGEFIPTAFSTTACEISLKVHPRGERWGHHYHTRVTETNLIIEGRMILQGTELVAGDIFVLEPYEIADPEFVEDCKIVCVKVPGGCGNDKVVFDARP